MNFLFIDTSSSNFLALFKQETKNDEIELVESRYEEGKASFIQIQIYNLLKAHSLQLSDINCLYYGAGPGSYTGMRVTQGLVGTFKILGIKSKGIYLYEVLKSNQLWISSAFKGEFFIFTNGERKLVNTEQANEILTSCEESYQFFSHHAHEIRHLDIIPNSIFDLICRDFLKLTELSGDREPYYYRVLEAEFSRAEPKIGAKR